jgi:hypothetical protein
MTMDRKVMCRIVLEAPPPGVDFALQVGRGSRFELVQKQRSTGKELCFDVSVSVRETTDKAQPDLGGPAVQGPKGQRFIYINSGTYAGQAATPWARRLKVPLVGITTVMVTGVLTDPHSVLEARVPGTAKDGGPNAATVKPFAGWKVSRPSL